MLICRQGRGTATPPSYTQVSFRTYGEQGSENTCIVRADVAKKSVPQLVIAYYQAHLHFST